MQEADEILDDLRLHMQNTLFGHVQLEELYAVENPNMVIASRISDLELEYGILRSEDSSEGEALGKNDRTHRLVNRSVSFSLRNPVISDTTVSVEESAKSQVPWAEHQSASK